MNILVRMLDGLSFFLGFSTLLLARLELFLGLYEIIT